MRFCAQCGTPLAMPPQSPQLMTPMVPAEVQKLTTVMPVASGDGVATAVQQSAEDVDTTVIPGTADDAATEVQEPVQDEVPAATDGAANQPAWQAPTQPIVQSTGQMPTVPIPTGPGVAADGQIPAQEVPTPNMPGAQGAMPGGHMPTGQVPTSQIPIGQPAFGQPSQQQTVHVPPMQPGAMPNVPGEVPTPGAQPGTPGPQPGMGVSSTMQSIRNNPTVRELPTPTVLKTAGVSLGIGLASALVLAVVATVVLTAGGTAALDQTAASSGMGGVFGGILTGPNFFQILVFALIAGVSGSFSLNMSANGVSLNSMASASLSLPVGLSGAALAVGAAFGAYLFARRLGVRFKWTGVASAVGVGAASGLVYVILGAIFPIAVSASYGGEGAGASLNGASFRTFAMAFALAGLGALAGYFLAQFAPDSSNVFLAAWRWTHRTRGFVRTVVESAAIYTAVFTVAALVTLVVAAVMTESATPLMLIPFAFPFLPITEFALGALGAVSFTVTGRQTTNLSVFTPNLGDSLWAFVLLIVVFVVTTLYIALRLSARNIYDRAYADWRHAWKSPVTAAVVWILVPFCVAGCSFGVSSAQTGGGTAGIAPAVWFFLPAAVWAFLVEAVALTFGPSMLAAMPGLWRLFVGGTVRPTPRSVTEYVAACDAAAGNPAGTPAPVGPQSPVPPQSPGTGQTDGTPHPAEPSQPPQTGQPSETEQPSGAVQPASPDRRPDSADGPSDASSTMPTAPILQTAPTTVMTAPSPVPAEAAVPPSVPTASADGGTRRASGATNRQSGPFTPPAPSGTAAASAPAAPSSTHPGYATTSMIPPTVPPSVPPAASAPRKPLTARQRLTLIVVGIVAAVAVALGVAYAALNATVFSPSHIAGEYLSAIASGDYERANEIADPQLDQSQRALLTDAASQTENATISNARVVSVDDAADGSKTVAVTYTIGGNTVNDTFTVAPTGSRFLVFPDWTITTPLLKRIDVSASAAVTELEINGIAVSAGNASDTDDTGMSFHVYPGTYRVSAAESDYVTSDTITLDTYDRTAGYVTAEPTDTLTDEIQSAVDEKLRTCAASTDAEPEGCPFGRYVFSSDRYRNFSWSVTESPTVDYVSLDDGTFSTDLGEAQATYEYQNYDETWEPDDYTDTFYVNGDFVIDGDGVTVTFDEDYW